MAVDQRLKFSTWATEFIQRGGDYQVKSATVDDLESLTRDDDLTVVAVGRGELSGVFARDDAWSTHITPQRRLIQFYVDGLGAGKPSTPRWYDFRSCPTPQRSSGSRSSPAPVKPAIQS
jgi:hypothetical protein